MDTLKKIEEVEEEFLDFMKKEILNDSLKDDYEKQFKNDLVWRSLVRNYSISKYIHEFGNLRGKGYNDKLELKGYELSEAASANRRNYSNIHSYLLNYFSAKKYSDFVLINLSKGKSDAFLLIIAGYTILIDSGISGNEQKKILEEKLEKVELVDMVIITHCDNDHIGGINELVAEKRFSNSVIVYNTFTSGVVSYNQAEYFERLINHKKIVRTYERKYNRFIKDMIFFSSADRKMLPEINFNQIYITFLHPKKSGVEAVYSDYIKTKNGGKADSKCINKNSIVFLLEYSGKALLFTGDAMIDDFLEELSQFNQGIPAPIKKIDYIKIPHHGAKENNHQLNKIVEMFCCKNLILTTSSDCISSGKNINQWIMDEIGKGELMFYVFENTKDVSGIKTGDIILNLEDN